MAYTLRTTPAGTTREDVREKAARVALRAVTLMDAGSVAVEKDCSRASYGRNAVTASSESTCAVAAPDVALMSHRSATSTSGSPGSTRNADTGASGSVEGDGVGVADGMPLPSS